MTIKRLILLFCLTLTYGTLFAENKIGAMEPSAKAVVTVSINLNVDLSDQMDNSQNSNPEDKTCYATFTFSTDCGNGTVYHYSVFVWGKCTSDFYRRAAMAALDVAEAYDQILC
ncbi:MAG: hypothetical protein WBJ36_00445 [Tenuifilum sp.]|uniref:hypothetical protein n=1 Tax=Tenuifilum sp. TaxID=2760880 RepID=UPI003CA38B46